MKTPDNAHVTAPPSEGLRTKRQLHFWVTDGDYKFVSAVAAENEETIAGTLRRMI
jgi:hypothetical protein